MRIAFVSYEFPPDTAFGGIATYVQQAAALLVQRGHVVDVFAASNKRSGRFESGNIGLNLVEEMNRAKFAEAIAPVFAKRHAICNFEIVESPEYFADGREILRSHPATPHIVKLHTPNQLIRHCSSCFTPLGWLGHNLSQLRVFAGALRRAKRPQCYHAYQEVAATESKLELLEKEYVKRCDFVVSPSKALLDWAALEWKIDRKRAMVVPNPYIPSKDLLNTPVVSNRKVVGFFGKLEYRKGVCALVEAIPYILKAEPNALFRFVGKPMEHPGTRESFDVFISRKLSGFKSSVAIVGPVELEKMHFEYDKVDVCVFPSIWENFPNVCLEAMSAAKAVVASNAGGMGEMLDGNCGLLVSPNDPKAIADSVISILRSDDLRIRMGHSARNRVLQRYSVQNVGPQIETSYANAIAASAGRRYNEAPSPVGISPAGL
ncbi:MAG: glycosyltransferase family 4 protein [Limisphaerales bacterium]